MSTPEEYAKSRWPMRSLDEQVRLADAYRAGMRAHSRLSSTPDTDPRVRRLVEAAREANEELETIETCFLEGREAWVSVDRVSELRAALAAFDPADGEQS